MYSHFSHYKLWSPWRGCHPVSEACENCFIQSRDEFEDRYYHVDLSQYSNGTIITLCLYSDFFLTEADKYRDRVWEVIKNHSHLLFKIITKRASRIADCLPRDWGEGYDNVILCVTVENQARAEERLPIVEKIPMKHRWIACTPMLEQIDLSKFLATGAFEMVEVLGERTYKLEARPIKHTWVLDMYEQCKEYNTGMALLGVGSKYEMEDGTVLSDQCPCYSSEIANSLHICNYIPITFDLKETQITV